jgi:hypothetical protein
MEMLMRDLLRSIPIADSILPSEDYISSLKEVILAIDCSNYSLFPEERLTVWIRVYVRATLAVFPSQTNCHERVFFNNPRA